MIVHPHPDPVAFEVFGFGVRWYGIMYLMGLGLAWAIGRQLLRRASLFSPLRGMYMEDIVTAATIGVVVGGRLGYMLFYNFGYYAENPAEILYLWQGGMSFHGGLLGVILSLWGLSRLHAIPDVRAALIEEGEDALSEEEGRALEAVTSQGVIFLRLADLSAVLAPIGLGLGRLGNFINAELPGRVTSPDLPWAMSFGIPDYLPRHPSPLYQMAFEGFVLAGLLLWLCRKPRAPGWLAGVFLAAYAGGRFFLEFFREPDAHLGLPLAGLSMGQLLCVPMFILGLALMYRLRFAVWRRAVAAGGGLGLRERIGRMLTAEPDMAWSEHERVYAEEYGADEGDEEDDEGGGFWGGVARMFGFGGDDEEEYVTKYRLTRRQKRRLKKKKRG